MICFKVKAYIVDYIKRYSALVAHYLSALLVCICKRCQQC
uniref:Uncharacterized protein n=1 Tax=Arundo donax TaxID=35708 RepID=A0A0A8ZEX6_ARUDO